MSPFTFFAYTTGTNLLFVLKLFIHRYRSGMSWQASSRMASETVVCDLQHSLINFNSDNWHSSKEEKSPCVGNTLYVSTTPLTLILSIHFCARKQAKLHLSYSIICTIGSFAHVIYSSAGLHCWQCESANE